MLSDVPTLNQLIQLLQQVPYLASKNVYKVASYILDMGKPQLEQFCASLLKAHDQLLICATCFFWKERTRECLFCSSHRRDQALICVVEQWYDLLAIEKTQGYMGVYHVLGGAISPLEGIGPEDLTIASLIKRVELGAREIILATNQTPEGEATAAFIGSKLKHLSVKITCLARGLPVGSSLAGMDRITIYKALSERRTF